MDDWKKQLQHFGDRSGGSDVFERHARRDFGPVPEGGAIILRLSDYRAHPSAPPGGRAA